MYINARDPHWLAIAEQLLMVYRDSVGRTRGEIAEELSSFIAEGPATLVHQGLAKLLEDRCEFEISSELPPLDVREVAFRLAAAHRQQCANNGVPFNREAVIREACKELKQTPEQIERALFADLTDEQRVLTFDDMTPEGLLHRYNVALAQALLLRSTHVEARVWNETPARFRQLFRAIKFHRLICTIQPMPGNSFTLKLDGPLSLFSSTQKYGLQLANFLPALLHCKTFDLRAEVRWGSQKKEKTFTLDSTDGLKSHYADFGTYVPPEVITFAENFRTKIDTWTLSDEAAVLALADTVWVPDFTLRHRESGAEIYVELFGFWRKGDIDAHYRRLREAWPKRFILVVSESLRADEADAVEFGPEVVRYKRTPSAEEVANAATRLLMS